MDGRVGCQRGGILGLVHCLTEHGEAIERDLLVAGLRLGDLGTDRLTWRELLVLVRWSPPGSALARSVSGTSTPTASEQLGLWTVQRLGELLAAWGVRPPPLALASTGTDDEPVAADTADHWGVEAVPINVMNTRLGPRFTEHLST